MTVESPGQLPGLVRPNNMREMHFSRNPKIIEFLHVYKYVKEFGEGVDRMYREMEDAGLPDPEYHVSSFMLCATLKNQKWGAAHKGAGESTPPPKKKSILRQKKRYWSFVLFHVLVPNCLSTLNSQIEKISEQNISIRS